MALSGVMDDNLAIQLCTASIIAQYQHIQSTTPVQCRLEASKKYMHAV
jgi:hypothetical protein